jgi:hypothetical protein
MGEHTIRIPWHQDGEALMVAEACCGDERQAWRLH